MSQIDGNQYEAHAVVEKWEPEQMAVIEKQHGKKKWKREELLALGHKPTKVTDDVVGDRPAGEV